MCSFVYEDNIKIVERNSKIVSDLNEIICKIDSLSEEVKKKA